MQGLRDESPGAHARAFASPGRKLITRIVLASVVLGVATVIVAAISCAIGPGDVSGSLPQNGDFRDGWGSWRRDGSSPSWTLDASGTPGPSAYHAATAPPSALSTTVPLPAGTARAGWSLELDAKGTGPLEATVTQAGRPEGPPCRTTLIAAGETLRAWTHLRIALPALPEGRSVEVALQAQRRAECGVDSVTLRPPTMAAADGPAKREPAIRFQPIATLHAAMQGLPYLVRGREQVLRPEETIVVNMRLPRVVLAALVGAVLAAAGACFQGLLKNPLADPYIIGVSSGAAVGVSLYVVFMAKLGAEGAAFAAAHPGANFLLGLGKPAIAFVFAAATMVLVHGLARQDGRISLEGFLLAGVVVGAFMWAIVFFLMTVAQRGLHRIAFFLMGNLQEAEWSTTGVVCVFAAIGIPVLYAFARDLNLMLLGEEPATHLGVRVESLKHVMIGAASLITAAAVSAVGIIGFAGFIVPHIMRRLVGPDHRILIPTACLAGAVFLIFADTVARTVLGANEIPTGVVTALIGAPFFCQLLRKRRAEG